MHAIAFIGWQVIEPPHTTKHGFIQFIDLYILAFVFFQLQAKDISYELSLIIYPLLKDVIIHPYNLCKFLPFPPVNFVQILSN